MTDDSAFDLPGGPTGPAAQTVAGIQAATLDVARRMPVLYGPVGTWGRVSALTEWARTDDRPERVAVARGDSLTGGPLVVLHTVLTGAEQTALRLHYGDRPDTGPDDPSDDDELPVLRRDQPTSAAGPVSVPVNGRPVLFTVRRQGDAWYGWAEEVTPGVGLVIETDRVTAADITIETVTDLDACSAGQRTLISRMLSA